MKNEAYDIIILFIYFDDIVLTGISSILLQTFISKLHKVFPLKDLGQLNYVLGIEVLPTSIGLVSSQHKYIVGLIEKVGLTSSKPEDTPMVLKGVQSKTDGDPKFDFLIQELGWCFTILLHNKARIILLYLKIMSIPFLANKCPSPGFKRGATLLIWN